MSGELFSAIIGLSLILVGCFALVKRQFSFTYYRRGWSDSSYKPVFTFLTLRESRAFLFGIISVIGGLVVLSRVIVKLLNIDPNAAKDDIVLIATLVGLFIAILGLVVATVNEYLNSIRVKASKKKFGSDNKN